MQNLDYTSIFTFRGKAYNEAMAAYPGARRNELAAILALFDLGPGDHVCDAPAGGGYMSDGIIERFGTGIDITCVEPAAEFGAAITPGFRVLNTPMVEVPAGDASFTAIGSLAGLHHIEDRSPIFREWTRLLAPGGQLAVADVPAGSATGDFLNGFVDQHTPQGHDGVFIRPGEFSALMNEVGITPATEEVVDVPWVFPTRAAVGEFCKKLFFLESASPEEVTEGIADTVGIEHDPSTDCWLMNWQLVYASGRKRTPTT